MLTNTDAISTFVQAALKDYWISERASNFDLAHCTLTRDGFTLLRFPASLYLFGPDKLQVIVPEHYSWREIRANLKRCSLCYKRATKVYQYSYAGRACTKCAKGQPAPDSSD